MRRRTLVVLALFLGALHFPLDPAVGAQAPAPTASSDVPTFAVGTTAVTLDIVVRDKKGRAVRDLTAADFEVYEDRVRQRVESFQVFGRPLPEPAPAPAAPAARVATPAPLPVSPEPPEAAQPQVIAFLFDRIGANARNLAHKAALTYLDKGHVEGDLVGVFAVDLALRTIQPFTRDTSLIRQGLDRAASQANTAVSADRGATRDLVDTLTTAEQTSEAVTGANPGQGGDGGSISASAGAAGITQAISALQVNMLRQFESLERDQQGYATSNALLAVVSGLKSLPGRKTVVFFSEGMVIPANVQDQFQSVIHTANRANVSVYAMDAGGLRAESINEETRKELLQAASRRQRQLASGADVAGGPMTRGLERNEDLLRLNPEAGLGQLADQTGGLLIRDTNDVSTAFRQMEEDMRFYYLLSYTPANETYDGRYRSISVKVNRPGVKVQSRQGYFAIKAAESTPLKSFEAPAIAQLDRSPRPAAFPIETLGLSFPEAKRPGLVPVLVHVPGNIVTYVPDKEDKSGKKMHRADFAVVVRVRNEAKHEVDRLSQRYVLSAPEASLAAARAGQILFYRESELPPGRYTLEAVGYDAVSQKASVGTASIEVPKVEAEKPRLSSVVLVGRAEKMPPSDQKSGNPLFFGETILYPNMGEPFRKAQSKALGFFFTAYAGKDPVQKATIEVYKGELPAGRVTADLPAPDASGRIQYAGALPLDAFPPGSYKLKVSVAGGAGVESRQTSFTLAE